MAFPALRSENIIVAQDGADAVPGLKVTPNQSNETEESKPRRFQIGYIGQLYAGRGVDLVLAIARLVPEHDFHLVGGYEKDLVYWKEQAQGLDNVTFHGYVPNGKLSDYYSRFDIMLAPYHRTVYTGNNAMEISQWISPMKVFEYMSYGKAMIVSDLKVIQEVMVNEQNCLLCPPEDVSTWVNAVRWLVTDEALRNQLAQNALNDLLTHHTWKARAQSILEQVAGQKS